MLSSLNCVFNLKSEKGFKWSCCLCWVVIVFLLIFTAWGCGKKGTEPEPKPVASFSADRTSGDAPLTVRFGNSSSGKITSCSWSFGDGQTSSDWSPTHKYTSAGTYTVSLTVSGLGGSDSKSKCNYITSSPSVKFLRVWANVYNGNQYIDLLADVRIIGYGGYTFAVGGYWFRKSADNYYYVKAKCDTAVPSNYLGHQWQVTANNDPIEKRIGFSMPYSCFKDRTGSYYGSIKLYKASSIPLDPNSCTHARTQYVKITWTSGSPNAHDDHPPLTVRILSDSETEELERAIAGAGGIKPDPDAAGSSVDATSSCPEELSAQE
jgi:PKD repeat protein